MLSVAQRESRVRLSVVENTSPMLDAALALSEAGVAVHWLWAKSKKPILDNWSNAPVHTPESLKQSYRLGYNVGIRPGEFSCVDGLYLGVIDLDVRDESKAAEAYAWLDKHWRDWRAFPTVLSGSGGSSRHIYFFMREAHRSRGLARSNERANYDGRTPWRWQIDLYGSGRQVAAPPSVHPLTGKPYRWLVPLDLDLLDMGCPPILDTELLQSWRSPVESTRAEQPNNDRLGLSIEEAEAILDKLPFEEWGEDRDGWIRVGMAVQHEFGDEGYDIWTRFSSRSDKFDPEDQERVWKSFRPRPDSIRMATLKQAVRAVEIAESFDDITDDESEDEGGAESDLLSPETKQNTSESGDDALDAQQLIKTTAAGDLDAGQRFARAYSNKFVHVYSDRRWLRWSGTRWEECRRGEEVEAAKSLAKKMLPAAALAVAKNPNERNKSHLAYAVRLNRDGARLHSVLGMARSVPGVAKLPDEFDREPMLLGVRNGVLDLRTGHLIAPSPEQFISKQAGAEFRPDALCPKWQKFLSDVLPDENIRRFVQLCVGYTLTGLVEEEKFFFAHGNGANGKSVFASVCEALLGDYAVTVNASLLTRNRNEGEASRLVAKLPGARLVLANETKQADVWDDQRIKEIVSRDTISARKLYGESFSFFPTHKLWVRGNHLPGAFDDSDGFWRRLVPLPFEANLPVSARIADLDRQIITEELSGVLNWALEGCLAWRHEGLEPPSEIRRTAAAYRSDTDILGGWIRECCSSDPNAKTKLADLYDSYRYFCSTGGMSSPTKPMFSRQLLQRSGIRMDASRKHGRRVVGLRLNTHDDGFEDDLL